MRIAAVSPYDFSLPSGVNSHVLALAQWLRRQGHEVRTIGPASSGNGLSAAGVTVVGKPRGIRVGGTVAQITLSPRLGSTVRSLLAAEQFDVVHLHEPHMPLLPLQFLRFSTALNVATFHAAEPLGGRLQRLAAPALRRWTRRLDVAIAVSPTARAALPASLAGSCHVIPCCIDSDHFARPLPPPPALRNGRRTILFVGRMEPRKGLPVLLQAYARVRAARGDTQLVIVGAADRRLQAQLRARGWEDVRFVGAVPYADLPAYYQAADIFCAPARAGEALGLVLAEAMAGGTPLIASDIAGYRGVVRAGVDGLLTPAGDAVQLARGIERLLDDAPLRQALRERGRERARDFSCDAVGPQILDLYDRHLGERRGRTA